MKNSLIRERSMTWNPRWDWAAAAAETVAVAGVLLRHSQSRLLLSFADTERLE